MSLAKPLPIPLEVANDPRSHEAGMASGVRLSLPWLQRLTACSVSAAVHAAVLLLLAIWLLPATESPPRELVVATQPPPRFESSEAFRLPQLSFADEPDSPLATQAQVEIGLPVVDAATLQPMRGVSSLPQLRSVDSLDIRDLLRPLPEATPRTHAPVTDYGEALRLLGEEISHQLEHHDVLLVWCFDQSLSMKDDQLAIRQQMHELYRAVAGHESAYRTKLRTMVASFGSGFQKHLGRPTDDLALTSKAIDEIPSDPSGSERLCEALLWANKTFSPMARPSPQWMLVVVTDETGDRAGNRELLEEVIVAARKADCRIFFLGREAAFGSQTSYMLFNGRWLDIDRGPESAYVEQLQTDGFHRRRDAFGSGFGPYEQLRLARETGGVFYMLPGMEASVAEAATHLYEPARLAPYAPDWSPRDEQLRLRDRSPLRKALWHVVQQLDHSVLDLPEIQDQFPAGPSLIAQCERAAAQAQMVARRMTEAQDKLRSVSGSRSSEQDRRWQANYDLIVAQVAAYEIRARASHFCLTQAAAAGAAGPAGRPVRGWKLETCDRLDHAELAAGAEQARKLLQYVVQQHAGTPWSHRAQWELDRGLGVQLTPVP